MAYVRVRNRTRGTVVAGRCAVAADFWSRLRGLIGRRALATGEGLLLVPARGVHMWFMRFPIDVIYIDREGRVVDVDERLKPWRIGRPRWRAHAVLEVPAGTVAVSDTRVGDELAIEPLEAIAGTSAKGGQVQ